MQLLVARGTALGWACPLEMSPDHPPTSCGSAAMQPILWHVFQDLRRARWSAFDCRDPLDEGGLASKAALPVNGCKQSL